MEVVAQLKNLRMSPKKIRLVANLMKGLSVEDALVQLRYMPKRSAPILAKLIKSAVANAEHNRKLQAETLMVKQIIVNEALALSRWKPAAHGSAHPFKRRGSHVIVTLQVRSETGTAAALKDVVDVKAKPKAKTAKKQVSKTPKKGVASTEKKTVVKSKKDITK